jgi:hypothetical protein
MLGRHRTDGMCFFFHNRQPAGQAWRAAEKPGPNQRDKRASASAGARAPRGISTQGAGDNGLEAGHISPQGALTGQGGPEPRDKLKGNNGLIPRLRKSNRQ